MMNIWKCLLVNSGVRIIGDDPKDVYEAVFAVASIISPFCYRDDILLAFSNKDERIENVEKYGIVATTSDINVAQRTFGIILNIKKKKSDIPRVNLIQCTKKSQKLSEFMIFLMNRSLIINPYNDILEYPIGVDDIEQLVAGGSSKHVFQYSDYEQFINTKTFKIWRKINVFRDSFRSYFLSNAPRKFLALQSKKNLKDYEKVIPMLKKRFKYDVHMISVLRQHEKIIKNLLTVHDDTKRNPKKSDLFDENYPIIKSVSTSFIDYT